MNTNDLQNTQASAGKGLQNVLAAAQEETRQKLEAAIEKKKSTGLSLMDVLRQDVDRQMFGKIWRVLNQPIGAGPSVERGPSQETKRVKDVLVEQGVVSDEDLGGRDEESGEYDHEIGRVLIERGQIT